MHRAVGIHDASVLRKLADLIRKTGPFDILHGHSSKAGALVRLLPRNIPGARIYTPHAFRTMDPTIGFTGKVIYSGIERVLSYFCKSIIVGSEQEADVAARMGIDKTKIRKILFGVDGSALPSRAKARDALGIGPDELVVGFVGRFVHQKAPERLINALPRLANPNTKLVLIGSGELEATLRNLSLSLGVAENVIFAGVRDGQASMPAFDVLAVPSRYESLGYVLLEAAVAGIPIVSSPVGVAADVIDIGRNGLIVANADDPNAWRTALDTMTEPRALQEAFNFARNRHFSFSIEKMVDDIEDVYTSVALRT